MSEGALRQVNVLESIVRSQGARLQKTQFEGNHVTPSTGGAGRRGRALSQPLLFGEDWSSPT